MAFISVQSSHKALSGIDIPIATTTVTPTSDTTTLYKNPNIGIQTNDIFADATNVSLSTANPLAIPFGAHYRHHFWTEFETVQGVRDFTLLLKELDQCLANGQVMNIKISEQEPPSGFEAPTFAYNYSGWTAAYDPDPTAFKYAYFGDSRVLDAWFAMHAALFALIKDHPAFGMIDIGWGAYMENTYSGTTIISIKNGAPGTVGQQIPDLTYAQGVEYYNRATNVYPANKILCYPEQPDQFLYATQTRKTGNRADSWGYRSAATVQCTDSGGSNYGKQFMCRTYAQTFAGTETVDTPYTASNPRAWLNGPLALETWDFFYRFSVTSSKTVTSFDAATNVVNCTSHGFSNGDKVRFFSLGGTLALPILSNTSYFVITANTNDFQISLTSGGAAVDITTAGTGTVTVSKGTDSTASWVGGNWDYASSFNWAISNHASVLNTKQKYDPPTSWVTRFQTLLRSIGYRYRITSFNYPPVMLAGKTATVTSVWRNNGNAPHYGTAVIGYRLRETTTNLKYYLSNQVACNFLPFATAGDKTITDDLKLPSYLPAGIYELAVGAIYPKGKFGYLKLAMSSPADDGARYYPMGNMTISNPTPTTNTENLSAHFDGVTLQYGKVTDNYAISLDGSVNWCTFIRAKFDDLSDSRVLLSRGDPGNVTTGVTQLVVYYSLSANAIRANLVDNAGNSVFATFGSAPTTGVWYNIYVEYTASSGDFTINVNDSASPVTANLVNPIQTVTTAMRLGVDNAGIRLMAGNISQAYIWKNRKLTSGEQTSFYNSGNGTYVPELTEAQRSNLYWALYTGRSQLQDGFGNHDLTNVGGVTFT